MKRQHNYDIAVKWTGNNGSGTSGYRDYNRSHSVISHNKANAMCFIAKSVNFPVHHRPECKVETTGPDQ